MPRTAPVSTRREDGVVLPSWLALTSLAAVAVAVLALFVTGGSPAAEQQTAHPQVPAASNAADPSRTAKPHARHHSRPAHHDKAAHRRHQSPTPAAYVEVYNNSAVTGLAAQTAGVLQDDGWNVVGTDNWYGDIPATTVYYPERLQDQARLLARDLGVDRVLPAVSPMRFDRLTVILTAAA